MKRTYVGKPMHLLALAIVCFFVMSSLAVAAEFSADLSIKTKGEDEVVGKIYIKGDKVRHEVTEEGEQQIMIVRPDKKVTWLIMPEDKTYMELPYQQDDKTFSEWKPEKEKGAKLLGEETVAGQPAKKYEVTENDQKTVYWVSKKYSIPLKMDDGDSVMEYKNIKEGAVDNALFELPAGYQKMSMPTIPEDGGQE